MKIKILSACILLAISSKATAEWKKEPTEILGIKLGQSIDSASLPSCPQSEWMNRHPKLTETCLWHRMNTGSGAMHMIGKPPANEIEQMSVVIDDDVAAAVIGSFRSNTFQKISEIFIEKYGDPTTVETKYVRSSLSSPIESKVLTWTGQSVSLRIEERSGSLLTGRFAMTTNAFLTKSKRDLKSDIERAASKF